MNSPLEKREVRLRGLRRRPSCVGDGVAFLPPFVILRPGPDATSDCVIVRRAEGPGMGHHEACRGSPHESRGRVSLSFLRIPRTTGDGHRPASVRLPLRCALPLQPSWRPRPGPSALQRIARVRDRCGRALRMTTGGREEHGSAPSPPVCHPEARPRRNVRLRDRLQGRRTWHGPPRGLLRQPARKPRPHLLSVFQSPPNNG